MRHLPRCHLSLFWSSCEVFTPVFCKCAATLLLQRGGWAKVTRTLWIQQHWIYLQFWRNICKYFSFNFQLYLPLRCEKNLQNMLGNPIQKVWFCCILFFFSPADAYKANNAGFTQNLCNSQVVPVKYLKAVVRTEPFIQTLKLLGKWNVWVVRHEVQSAKDKRRPEIFWGYIGNT